MWMVFFQLCNGVPQGPTLGPILFLFPTMCWEAELISSSVWPLWTRFCSERLTCTVYPSSLRNTLHFSPFFVSCCYQNCASKMFWWLLTPCDQTCVPWIYSLYFELFIILKSFVHVCLSQIFLSLRIITFSFSFHLNYFDLPSNFFSFICFFLHLCWLECLGCMANPCTCANALSCGRTGPQCQQMKATRGSWAGTHHLLSCRCGLLFYGGN